MRRSTFRGTTLTDWEWLRFTTVAAEQKKKCYLAGEDAELELLYYCIYVKILSSGLLEVFVHLFLAAFEERIDNYYQTADRF